MMGAQKYLPDDLDVKEQKDAHIGRHPAVTKKTDFLCISCQNYISAKELGFLLNKLVILF